MISQQRQRWYAPSPSRLPYGRADAGAPLGVARGRMFYGFEAIYSAERLDYRDRNSAGGDFGPVRAREARLARARRTPRPAFVFFPTVNTHARLGPVPPYQPDWPGCWDASVRGRGGAGLGLSRGMADLRPGYADAMNYTHRYWRDTCASTRRGPRDDPHRRPPAAGPRQRRGCPWEVPVHVITPPGRCSTRCWRTDSSRAPRPGGPASAGWSTSRGSSSARSAQTSSRA